MATLTIRQLDEKTHARLRSRAAGHGRSVEAEVRAILDATVNRPEVNILIAIQDAFGQTDGIDLDVADRTDLPRTVELS